MIGYVEAPDQEQAIRYLEMRQGSRIINEIEGSNMIGAADKRGEIIKHLEDAMAIASELNDGPTEYS